jgi:hypothetical protein
METLEIPVSPPRSRQRRRTFIKEDVPLPELTRQVSDVKLSKKGTNVYVRFRPDNYKEEKEGTQCVDYFPDLKTVNVENHSFRFKRIFPGETTQDQIFLSIGVPLVEPMMDGYNCGVLAYGQTGAGKTFTLFGHGFDSVHRNQIEEEGRGLVPRLLQTLFHDIQLSMSPLLSYTVFVSFIQIYNEKIFDLINAAKEPLKLYQSAPHGIWLTDATSVPVKNSNEVLNQLKLGMSNRVTAPTLSNAESSRSHAVMVLTINKNITNTGTQISSQVYLVDLCGSERISKTGAYEERLKEAQNINKSLLSLGNVISALVENKKHIPYRDSKLTRLLQNCFGGTSIATIVLCCSANSVNSVETLATLRFGDRANKVKNKPVRNTGDSVADLRRLLTEANTKIFCQQKIVRTQLEKIIELEMIVKELVTICGHQKLAALQTRFKVTLNSKKKNGFEIIGFYPFINVFIFVTPLECCELMKVCKLFEKRLQNDLIWKAYLESLKTGKCFIPGIYKEQFSAIPEDGIYKYISSIRIPSQSSSASSKSGLELFRNVRST